MNDDRTGFSVSGGGTKRSTLSIFHENVSWDLIGWRYYFIYQGNVLFLVEGLCLFIFFDIIKLHFKKLF
jgi:hypothetical protein